MVEGCAWCVEDGERFCSRSQEQWTCVESKKLSPSQDHTNERFVLGVMILLPIQYTIAFYPISTLAKNKRRCAYHAYQRVDRQYHFIHMIDSI